MGRKPNSVKYRVFQRRSLASLLLLGAFLAVVRCEQRRTDISIAPPPVKRLGFTAIPVGQVEIPNSPSDLDRYDVRITANLISSRPIEIFRAMGGAPEVRQSLGFLQPGDGEFIDRSGIKIDAQYRYSFAFQGFSPSAAGQDPAISDVVVQIPRDTAILGRFDASGNGKALNVGRLFLGPKAIIETHGLELRISVNELIAQSGAIISVGVPAALPGTLEIWAREAHGELLIAPDFPGSALNAVSHVSSPSPASRSAGSQEVRVHVASQTSIFSVIPVLEKPPEPGPDLARAKWAGYQRPFVVQRGTSRKVLCGGHLMPTEDFSGVYARPMPGGGDPFYYLITPTHGKLATLSNDPMKKDLYSVAWAVSAMGPLRCEPPSSLTFPYFGDPKGPNAPSFAPVPRLKGDEAGLPPLIPIIVREIRLAESLDRLFSVDGLSVELDVPEWNAEVGYSLQQADLLSAINDNPKILIDYLHRHQLKTIHFTPHLKNSIEQKNGALYVHARTSLSTKTFMDNLAKDSLPIIYP